MFKIETEDGKRQLRPMYVGYIKNNIIRRTAMTLVYPFIVLLTVIYNAFQALFIIAVIILRWVFQSVAMCFKPPWKDPRWYTPRVKEKK